MAFSLAHAAKVNERVPYFTEHQQAMRERLLSADKLLTWTEFQTVETAEHPHTLPQWNFSRAFPNFPVVYRRSVIKDAVGKVRSYLSNLAKWDTSGKKRGKPGLPGANNHPTFYNSQCFEQRRTEPGWEQQSPKLVLRHTSAALHVCQTKEIKAKKVMESKRDPGLVTVAVDLNVKNLAVISVRQHERIVETVFVTDHGLDQHRYRHLKRIANVCAKYPSCVLVFERLRKIRRYAGSKSRRMNRTQANQLRGKINQQARAKAYAQGIVTVEVNPWGTSQHCCRCGAKGERFSLKVGERHVWKGGKLFACPICHYEANADHNASVNLHHSFYQELCWQPKPKPPPQQRSEATPCIVRHDVGEACGGQSQ